MTGIMGKLAGLLGKNPVADVAAEHAPPSPQPQPPPAAPSRFVPSNPLEEALVRAVQDPAARSAFTALALQSELLVATPEAPERGEHRTLESDETISILNIRADNGASYPAVFTSEARLMECFGAGAGFMALKGDALLAMIADTGAWLNPASDCGVMWAADDIAAMLGQPVTRTVQQDTQVMLGEPHQRPEQLIANLTAALAEIPQVDAAWLALAHWPAQDEWGWFLDIRADVPGDQIVPQFADAFDNNAGQGKAIDIRVQSIASPPGIGIRLKPVALN